MHHCDDLIHLFNQCFEADYRTILVRGADEPLYLPSLSPSPENPHQIIFAHGYFSSALHECAHWLIAGAARRQLEDYGYWYYPDGRNAEQQRLFESVEVKPQAIEWVLSNACHYPFQFSFDNLNGALGCAEDFKQAVIQQVAFYEQHGLPPRAHRFRQALTCFYQS